MFSHHDRSLYSRPDHDVITDSSTDIPPSLSQTYLSPKIAELSTTVATPGSQLAAPETDTLDLSSALDTTTLQLRKHVPRELVVTMFQKMVSS